MKVRAVPDAKTAAQYQYVSFVVETGLGRGSLGDEEDMKPDNTRELVRNYAFVGSTPLNYERYHTLRQFIELLPRNHCSPRIHVFLLAYKGMVTDRPGKSGVTPETYLIDTTTQSEELRKGLKAKKRNGEACLLVSYNEACYIDYWVTPPVIESLARPSKSPEKRRILDFLRQEEKDATFTQYDFLPDISETSGIFSRFQDAHALGVVCEYVYNVFHRSEVRYKAQNAARAKFDTFYPAMQEGSGLLILRAFLLKPYEKQLDKLASLRNSDRLPNTESPSEYIDKDVIKYSPYLSLYTPETP